MRPSSIVATVTLASLAFTASADAVDQPLDAAKLVLKRTATRESLAFVSRDPAFLFPPPGSGDDPATGNPGGATIEMFSANGGTASITVPPGVGKPGWTIALGAAPRFEFRNALAPGGPSSVRFAVLKQGRVLKVMGRVVGLPMTSPQGAVGIRITTGTRRNCALFDAATVRRDDTGQFVARNALASSLADCSDAALGGPPTTTTTLPPCHLIFDPVEPMCGGACPAGERCVDELDATIQPQCVCLSESVTPCNGSGYPACGGGCSGGKACQAVHLLPGETPELRICACVDPSDTCADPPGTCFAVGVCPPGSACVGSGPPQSECGCGPP
jgi:hypothetical protein